MSPVRIASTSSMRQKETLLEGQRDVTALFGDVSFGGIIANIRPPSIGLVFFLVAINCIFILPIIFPGLNTEARTSTARFAYAAASALLFVGGICEMIRGGMWSIRHQCLWLLLTSTVILFMIARGFLESADIYLLLRNAGIFALLLTLPAIAVHRDNWPWLWLTFIVHAWIGLPMFYYVIVSEQLTSRSVFLASELARVAGASIYLSSFLFLMLPILRGRWLRLLAILLFTTGLVSALLVGKRGPWFHAAITLCILTFVMFRIHGVHRYLARVLPRASLAFASIFLVFVLGFVAFFSSHDKSAIHEVLASSYRDLEARMLQMGSVTETILQNERWMEVEGFFSAMDPMDWIFGKGLTGHWGATGFHQGQEVFMVHNTWLNCFFWGGVGLFLVVFWPLLWALRVILFSKSPVGMCCAGVVLQTYWMFPFYRITGLTPRWILLCIVIGVCRWEIVAMRRRRAQRTVPPAV